MNKNHKYPPELGREIVCKGSDWSDFTCIGVFKKGGRRERKRFYVKDKNGDFWPDIDTWKNVKSWDYADESTASSNEGEE